MISAFDECLGSVSDKDHLSRILKVEKCVRKGVNLLRRSTHGLNNMHLEIQTTLGRQRDVCIYVCMLLCHNGKFDEDVVVDSFLMCLLTSLSSREFMCLYHHCYNQCTLNQPLVFTHAHTFSLSFFLIPSFTTK